MTSNSETGIRMAEASHEQLQRERDAWKESAAQFCRGAEYYRGLLDRIGRAIGPEAYVADDGSVSDDVLRAKVPEIIEKRLAASPDLLEALRAMVKNFRSYSECRGDDDVLDQALAAIAKAEGRS
jgi:hypothetical protein